MELLEILGVDWRLLAAQVVNFAILLAVLWYLAYRPLQKLLREREERVAASLRKAQEIEARAAALTAEEERRRTEAEAAAATIIEEARREARALREELTAAAREEGRRITEQARKRAEGERAAILAEVRRDIARLALAAARKILEREASNKEEGKLVERLVRGLEA